MRLPTRTAACALLAAAGLMSCGSGPDRTLASAPAARSIDPNGPAADYPMVLGPAYTIGETTFTPADTLNIDQVGYATLDAADQRITIAHRTLPMPSYVEVTALASGRTILARVERRGPMDTGLLIGLSAGAAAQLGVSEGAAVRMRRVNPPENQRARLRSGMEAPLRMDTPQGLLEVLRRRLPASGTSTLTDPRQVAVSGRAPDAGALARIDPDAGSGASQAPIPVPTASPAFDDSAVTAPAVSVSAGTTSRPAARPPEAPARFEIQLGAFSVRANAESLARKVAGRVVTRGNLALVRVGAYSSRGQAEAALAKLRSEGYSGAQIRPVE